MNNNLNHFRVKLIRAFDYKQAEQEANRFLRACERENSYVQSIDYQMASYDDEAVYSFSIVYWDVHDQGGDDQ
ncbi:hypothetical protein ABID56_002618 [Alkalibacillus flavidus]|uniref:Sporulation protein Cse60 n=1 Tax=Alkalibacillus flavidus TaxID=546021 RepID=A0ABV2KY17_9BACI